MRNWVTLEESQIHDIWSTSMKQVENIFKSFRHIEISYDAFKKDNYRLGT